MKKGTCQVCFAAHPINKDGRVRKHLRGGISSGERDCAGAEFKPFEVDCTGLRWVFDSYLQRLAKAREQLLTVHLTPEVYEAGTWVDPKDGFGVVQNVVHIIKSDNPRYEQLIDQRRFSLNYLIDSCKHGLGEMDKVIKYFEPSKCFLEDDDYEPPGYVFAPIHHKFFIIPPEAA
ncbi:hypothetical protein V0M98_32630 (plasmid) [Pseudomonas silesiensis]|uniref:hypothetical protein n=1 Tax=Pseudomonas silesiensis TaxID=1853130 RepID=UPI0030D3467A